MNIHNFILYGTHYACLVCGSYSLLLSTMKLPTIWPFQKRIKDQEELESVVKEEAEKLGLDYNKIKAEFSSGGSIARKFVDSDKYILRLNNGLSKTRGIVRHELYHIYKGDCEKNSYLYYYLVAEPKAIIYSLLNIKL